MLLKGSQLLFVLAQVLYVLFYLGRAFFAFLHFFGIFFIVETCAVFVHQLIGVVAVIDFSLLGVQLFGISHFKLFPVYFPVEKILVIYVAVQVYLLRCFLLHVHVAAVLFQLPGIYAPEFAFYVHDAGKTVRHAQRLAFVEIAAPFPKGLSVCCHLTIPFVADFAETAHKIRVEGLEVEPVLPYPIPNAEVGGVFLFPFRIAEVCGKVAFGKAKRISSLSSKENGLAEISSLSVVHFHPCLFLLAVG